LSINDISTNIPTLTLLRLLENVKLKIWIIYHKEIT
jgi:hypothetical protein